MGTRRIENVYGSFEDAYKYDRQRELDSELYDEIREQRRKRKAIWKILSLWILMAIIGGATFFCYKHSYIPFLTAGLIAMFILSIILVVDWNAGVANTIILGIISLLVIALFWQFHMWWWLVGTVAYLIFIIFLSCIEN